MKKEHQPLPFLRKTRLKSHHFRSLADSSFFCFLDGYPLTLVYGLVRFGAEWIPIRTTRPLIWLPGSAFT